MPSHHSTVWPSPCHCYPAKSPITPPASSQHFNELASKIPISRDWIPKYASTRTTQVSLMRSDTRISQERRIVKLSAPSARHEP